MACPTCDHSMESLGIGWFWCPRCGTIRRRIVDTMTTATSDSVPELVNRCRRFESHHLPDDLAGAWLVIGIRESINRPEDRP